MSLLGTHEFSNIEAASQSAEHLANGAKQSLEALVSDRRRKAERITQVFESMKGLNQQLHEDLSASRRHNVEITNENETLKKNHVLLLASHRRLYLGFCALLKSVEDACGSEVGVDQRIEALLLSSEIGNGMGARPDIVSTKARDFLAATDPNSSYR